jgi:integrase/recombinase XerC
MIKVFQTWLKLNIGYSQQTVLEYGKDLRHFVTWLTTTTDKRRFSLVTRQDVENWVSCMSAAQLAPATIKKRVSALRGLYQYAWQQGLTKENPAKWVATPKRTKTLPHTLTASEISMAIADGSIPLSTRIMIAILAETGLRISELLNLRRCDFDASTHSILIQGKGRKERRVFYGNLTSAYLSSTFAVGHGKLFEIDDRTARYDIWNALRKHSTAAKCSSHIIRHTWATEMLNSGASLMTISKLLGHSSVKTTEIYAQLTDNTIKKDYETHCMQLDKLHTA